MAGLPILLSHQPKLSLMLALAAQSLVLIEEVENVDSIIKDQNCHKERATGLQGSLNKSKRELRIVSEERKKLKADLQTDESDVAEFSKRCDCTIRAQELTAKALEEATEHKNRVMEKVAELKNAVDSLKAINSQLKEENP
ncbi:Uncharacterized protein Fot_42972 [Forsythia ovata]|uniref:RAB6-interacting golgin n=1 Tax=Forsythia ovata TaxID=205694 RepID=A0ABD1RMQ2_9LAMI